MPYWGIFGQKCHIWVILTKNILSGYFWARFLKKLLPYLKSAPSNLSICKISRKKQKMPKFGTKNVVFEYFGARI